jgi:hypothetical protein
MVLAFFENERREIRKVVDYSKNYIQTDDLLDMKNGEMATLSEGAGHSVLVGVGPADEPCLGNGLAKHMQRFKRIVY